MKQPWQGSEWHGIGKGGSGSIIIIVACIVGIGVAFIIVDMLSLVIDWDRFNGWYLWTTAIWSSMASKTLLLA